MNALSDDVKNPSGYSVWSDGELIIAETESAARAVSCVLTMLYSKQGDGSTLYIDVGQLGDDECNEIAGAWYVNVTAPLV